MATPVYITPAASPVLSGGTGTTFISIRKEIGIEGLSFDPAMDVYSLIPVRRRNLSKVAVGL
jgi:hypothetical protein